MASVQRRVSAREAAEFLGISLPTLYAYVSRGKLRSFPGPGRGHSYAVEELERLRVASQARSGHAPAAAGALLWGAPVLTTELSAVSSQGPLYRGTPALELARSGVPFEAVAELLWSGGALDPSTRWAFVSRAPAGARRRDGGAPMDRLLLVLPLLALEDTTRFLQAEAAEIERARRLVVRLVLELARGSGARAFARARRAVSLSEALLVALGGRATPEARAALDAALVLIADHELNPSTFAARIAASTGADLYACLTAALATLSGPLHGGATGRIEELVREVGSSRRARSAILGRTRRGESVFGFGHPLYPAGDPRASLLLELAWRLAPRHPELGTLRAVVRAMQRLGHEAPTVDVGLVALAMALGFEPGAAQAVFAIGRSAGWVAHVLEQRRSGALLRPRAEYRGPG